MEQTQEKQFYKYDELLAYKSQGYHMFFCIGGRNIGKSSAFQKKWISDFIKKGKKIIFFVRNKSDIELRAEGYYDESWWGFKKWFPDYEYMFKKGQFWLKKKTDKTWKQFGYTVAIRQSGALKSIVKMQDAATIVFEEAFPSDENDYIKNAKNPFKEVKKVIELYQTLSRGVDGQQTAPKDIFFISNLYHMNNMYFLEFHILDLILNNKDGLYKRFYTYNKGNLKYVLEFSQLKSEATGMETDEDDLGFSFQDYRNDLKYIKGPLPSDNKVYCQLTFDGKYFINIAKYNDSIVAFKGKKPIENNKCVNFTCRDYKDAVFMNISLFKKGELFKAIYYLFNANTMYYDSLQTFMHLSNIMAY